MFQLLGAQAQTPTSLLLLVWTVGELLQLVGSSAFGSPLGSTADVGLARLLGLGFGMSLLFAGFGTQDSLLLLSLELSLCGSKLAVYVKIS